MASAKDRPIVQQAIADARAWRAKAIGRIALVKVAVPVARIPAPRDPDEAPPISQMFRDLVAELGQLHNDQVRHVVHARCPRRADRVRFDQQYPPTTLHSELVPAAARAILLARLERMR
jgi:hypothetical protein